MSFAYSVPNFQPRRRDLLRCLFHRKHHNMSLSTLPVVSSFYDYFMPTGSTCYNHYLPVASGFYETPLPVAQDSMVDQVGPLESLPVTDVPAPVSGALPYHSLY